MVVSTVAEVASPIQRSNIDLTDAIRYNAMSANIWENIFSIERRKIDLMDVIRHNVMSAKLCLITAICERKKCKMIFSQNRCIYIRPVTILMTIKS